MSSEASEAFQSPENSSHESDFYHDTSTESSHELSYSIRSPSSGATDAQVQSRKRSRSGEPYRRIKSKRLKGCYNDNYRALYNDCVTEAAKRFGSSSPSFLARSQIGLSKWSSQEKEVFFNATAKLGRDNIPGIARAIGSKSQVEVREYLLLLRESYVQHNLNEAQAKAIISPREIPAAVELSEECCNSLDTAGEALAWYQENYEAKQEQKKFGDCWLLGQDLAEEIEAAISETATRTEHALGKGDSDDQPQMHKAEEGGMSATKGTLLNPEPETPQILASVPAAQLLRLEKWIELSRELFMNSGIPGLAENWRAIADPGEEPSLYHTAFEDFHRLAVSVTQRLVQTAIFQAMSRLRAQDWRTSHSAKPFVRKRDVLTAIDILGMKHDSKDFWITTARRCGVLVYEENRPKFNSSPRRKNRRKSMNYDAVEELLEKSYGGKSHSKGLEYATPQPLNLTIESQLTQTKIYYSQSEQSSLGHDSSSGSDFDGLPMPARRRERKTRKLEHDEDEYAENFDQKTSRLEEEALWTMLGQEPPAHVKEEHEDLPNVPTKRKEYDDLVDWRDWTDYQAEWERYGGIVSREEFLTNRVRVSKSGAPQESSISNNERILGDAVSEGEESSSSGMEYEAFEQGDDSSEIDRSASRAEDGGFERSERSGFAHSADQDEDQDGEIASDSDNRMADG